MCVCVALTPESSGFDCSLNGPFDIFLLMHPFIKEIRHHGHLRQTALPVSRAAPPALTFCLPGSANQKKFAFERGWP